MPRKLSPRKHPSQERARATVDALIAAAAQVLEAEGDDGFTTNKIAERAGVSIGTLYQYFPNKEALILGLIQAQHERIRTAVRAELATCGEAPLPQVVRSVLRSLLDVYRPNLRLSANVEKVAATLGDRSGVEVVLEEIQVWTSEFLELHREALGLREPQLMSFLLVRALEGVLLGVSRKNPDLLRDELLLEQLERMVLGYLAPAFSVEVQAQARAAAANDSPPLSSRRNP